MISREINLAFHFMEVASVERNEAGIFYTSSKSWRIKGKHVVRISMSRFDNGKRCSREIMTKVSTALLASCKKFEAALALSALALVFFRKILALGTDARGKNS